jgi:Ala-tRNA(Pro) deacylase
MTVSFLTGVERTWEREQQVAQDEDGEEAFMAPYNSCRARLAEYFLENSVVHQLLHHPLAYTARGVAASEHIPALHIAKVVIVIADAQTVMVVLPGSHELDPGRLATALDAREARLATEVEFAPMFPDCEVGAMPPFGNLYRMPVYVDRSLTEDADIVFQAGTHTDTLRIAFADFVRLVNPTVIDVARERHMV